MEREDYIPAFGSQVHELEQKLKTAEFLLDAEKERAYFLEVELANLNYARTTLQHENDHYCELLRSQRFAGSGEICVRPRFGPAHVRARRNTGFIIMPFGPEWADRVDQAVAEALRRKGMQSQRADRLSARNVMKDSWIGMCEAGLIIADVTGRNPNVMYELGLADSTGLDVILIGQSATPGDLPFDLLGDRVLVYSASDPEDLTRRLVVKIEAMRLEQDARTGRRT